MRNVVRNLLFIRSPLACRIVYNSFRSVNDGIDAMFIRCVSNKESNLSNEIKNTFVKRRMSQGNQRRMAETVIGRVFTFTIGNVKQLSFQSMLESAEKHLYDS